MTILDIGRGSYRKIINGKAGFVTVEGIKPPDNGTLMVDFNWADKEKKSIVQCFKDKNHVYAFGHDPEGSGFSVTYLVFLGQSCMKYGKFTLGSAFKTLTGSYEKARISQRKKTVTVSFGPYSVVGIVVAMDVRIHDPELHTVLVTVSGNIVSNKK